MITRGTSPPARNRDAIIEVVFALQTGITGGTWLLNMIAVADDGVQVVMMSPGINVMYWLTWDTM